MSDQSSQEPTMEEILASIRRIISEDDAPASEEAAPEPEAEPEPEPAFELPPLEEDEDDGVLELTEKVDSVGDLDVYAATTSEPEEEESFDLPPLDDGPGEGLVSDPTAAAAAAAFGALSKNILMPPEGRTLEDVVKTLLRPLLKQWLDDNLPGIVETAVQAEVERIARGRR
ncbi:MAG TPA: DUF2497 domain-containing protein [Phenylobacterium sp.]|nr:DUF2497 domain-containing protein [Phenylobacterium sp.]